MELTFNNILILSFGKEIATLSNVQSASAKESCRGVPLAVSKRNKYVWGR